MLLSWWLMAIYMYGMVQPGLMWVILLVLKAGKATQGHKAQQVHKDLLDLQDHKATQDLKEQLAL